MRGKFLALVLIFVAIGVAFLIYIDDGSRQEQLHIVSEGEWKGYYQLTLNDSITRENIVGGGPANLTIKRQAGDKLVVYANDTGYGSKKDLKIELLENNQVIAENSSDNHNVGVWLYN